MKHKPPLDHEFIPAILWNRHYTARVHKIVSSKPLGIAIEHGDGTVSVFHTMILPHTAENRVRNIRYVERLVKFLLWQCGGYRVFIAGEPEVAGEIRTIYSPGGARAFDFEFMGRKVYGREMEILACDWESFPESRETSIPLGRNLDGCRIGFDLGGSDRKCAALIDGQVVFSEEVRWDPYFQSNPQYHYDGIRETLRHAAEHLPRVDAIGGSSAGVYVNNEVRVASLFRGVPEDAFEKRVRRMFFDLQKEWGGIPLPRWIRFTLPRPLAVLRI